MHRETARKKIAVVGSGISGISAAYFLSRKYEVHLYEKDNRLGGHTHTVEVARDQGKGGDLPIDTGFMVFNEINYPTLVKFFSRLSIDTISTEMSLSVCDYRNGLEYCGNRWGTIFSQKKNLFRPPFLKMLWDVIKFHKEINRIQESPLDQQMTVKDFIVQNRYGDFFFKYYLIPFVTAVWSTPPVKMMNFSVSHLIGFLQNHGLLDYPRMYEWKTIRGGSQTYVDQILKKIKVKVFSESPVTKVREMSSSAGAIKIFLKDGKAKVYDKVVLATHADQSLAMIENPPPRYRTLLGAYAYQKNLTYLHTDPTPLPRMRKNWASWNVRTDYLDPTHPRFSTTYYMNELQRVSDPEDYFVTLNPLVPLEKSKIIKKIIYHHPVFNADSFALQKHLPELNRRDASIRNLFFCGSYFGYGFHEDAILSSLKMSEQILGETVAWY